MSDEAQATPVAFWSHNLTPEQQWRAKPRPEHEAMAEKYAKSGDKSGNTPGPR